MTATRDLREIAARMHRLFADRGLSPAIETTDESFVAELDVSRRDIDGGAYVIDRRPDHPRHTIPHDVAGRHGFRLSVSVMPMLPQILTQYMAPPSPRGGILQTFANNSPDGERLSQTLWFTPDTSSAPYLVVELETGLLVGDDFIAAILDRIAPRLPPTP